MCKKYLSLQPSSEKVSVRSGQNLNKTGCTLGGNGPALGPQVPSHRLWVSSGKHGLNSNVLGPLEVAAASSFEKRAKGNRVVAATVHPLATQTQFSMHSGTAAPF